MLSAKYAALVFGVMFIALAFNASAQWSPGGAMVYMGDLNLLASSASSGKAVQAPEGSPEVLAATNNSSLSNSSVNVTSMDSSNVVSPMTQASDTTAVNSAAVKPLACAVESPGKKILDLSGYSRDRADKNLAGYTNIMYPISGSRGSTTSTAGGASGCGGCS
ncbi:MAG: hypothetical protein WAW52_06420 [Methanothrix sp.]|jgi:hypothetical protein